jgi:hypothetical protein
MRRGARVGGARFGACGRGSNRSAKDQNRVLSGTQVGARGTKRRPGPMRVRRSSRLNVSHGRTFHEPGPRAGTLWSLVFTQKAAVAPDSPKWPRRARKRHHHHEIGGKRRAAETSTPASSRGCTHSTTTPAFCSVARPPHSRIDPPLPQTKRETDSARRPRVPPSLSLTHTLKPHSRCSREGSRGRQRAWWMDSLLACPPRPRARSFSAARAELWRRRARPWTRTRPRGRRPPPRPPRPPQTSACARPWPTWTRSWAWSKKTTTR